MRGRWVLGLGPGLLATAVLLSCGNRTALGLLAGVSGRFDTPTSHLTPVGVLLVTCAALGATEAVGPWTGRRWRST